MATQTFFMRLIPPRPTFDKDMSSDELALMRDHAAYFQRAFDAGRLLAFGPVFAASVTFGMAIIDAEDEAEARAFCDGDPTIVAGLHRYELSPMQLAGSRASSQIASTSA